MSPRDLVYVGHMLDMARKAVSNTQGISHSRRKGDGIASKEPRRSAGCFAGIACAATYLVAVRGSVEGCTVKFAGIAA
jgi:hypothetical protein